MKPIKNKVFQGSEMLRNSIRISGTQKSALQISRDSKKFQELTNEVRKV